MTKSEKGSVSKTTETMEHEEKIQAILKSGLALGHKTQDILEVHGIENRHARRAAHAIAATVGEHLKLLGGTFAENGHSECGKALLFEAENLFDS